MLIITQLWNNQTLLSHTSTYQSQIEPYKHMVSNYVMFVPNTYRGHFKVLACC